MSTFVDTNTPDNNPRKVETFVKVTWACFLLIGIWMFFRSYQKGNFQEDLTQNIIWIGVIGLIFGVIVYMQRRSNGR